ncbi:MAG: hypothetical protein J7L15_02205 [Clostridiales bacterium]|nr:hypothetical protein [Clostridiales bacterium]
MTEVKKHGKNMLLKKNVVYYMKEAEWTSTTIVIKIDTANQIYYFRDIITTFDWNLHHCTRTILGECEWLRPFCDIDTLNIKILGTKEETPEYFL